MHWLLQSYCLLRSMFSNFTCFYFEEILFLMCHRHHWRHFWCQTPVEIITTMLNNNNFMMFFSFIITMYDFVVLVKRSSKGSIPHVFLKFWVNVIDIELTLTKFWYNIDISVCHIDVVDINFIPGCKSYWLFCKWIKKMRCGKSMPTNPFLWGSRILHYTSGNETIFYVSLFWNRNNKELNILEVMIF